MVMLCYSLLLASALTLSAPWWGWRMLTSGRYRAGLGGRLGRVPAALKQACAGKRVVWVHAVSVGEVLAVTRLIAELRQALGEGWLIALSTTTATGQHIARERLPADTVFWFPLDFAFAVRPYLRTLHPELVVLVEGELWPRVLYECEQAGIPVVVVNARVSDRGFRRTMRLRTLWLSMANRVTLWLAQGEETAGRLRQLGVTSSRIRIPGNLKYDLPPIAKRPLVALIQREAQGRKIVIAGSTLEAQSGVPLDEEHSLIEAWEGKLHTEQSVLLVLAPRHPERFGLVTSTAIEFRTKLASDLLRGADSLDTVQTPASGRLTDIVVMDTLGDLAEVYSIADVAFIGGSLVAKGGHNPLEAARFGVPVIMGPSYENFREIVEGMRAADAIHITTADNLAESLIWALREGKPMGERGRLYFEAQAGATARTVKALLERLHAHA